MLKIVHVLTGVAALVLSFVPSLSGGLSPLVQPEALCLLLLGLLNAQFACFTQPRNGHHHRPMMIAVSALLIAAAVIQALVLLIPVVAIAGLPATLASLLLAVVAVVLHLATAQSGQARPAHRGAPTTPRSKSAPVNTAAPSAGRETGTVKWFNTSKGFGFISRDSGDDVFVHFRAIRGDGHRILVEGQRVEFTIMMRDKGLQAEDVVQTNH